jgi:hypothetical protein
MPWGTAYDTTTISPDICKRSSTPAGFSANRLRQYSVRAALPVISVSPLQPHSSTASAGIQKMMGLRDTIYVGKTRQSIAVSTLESPIPSGLAILFSFRSDTSPVHSPVETVVICCTELRLGSKSYVTMTMMWTIIIAWLAIQLPLGLLIGKVIKSGTGGYAKRSPSSDPGIVWC